MFIFLLMAGSMQAQSGEAPLTDELLSTIQSDPIRLTGIFQTFGDFAFTDADDLRGQSFRIGTARLGLAGGLDDRIRYRLQFRLESQPNLLDAWLQWQMDDWVALRVGAQKPQVSREQIYSTGTTDFMRRAQLTGRQIYSREIGLSLHGERDGFGYNVGMYNGVGVQTNSDNRFQYTARGTWRGDLREGTELQLGASTIAGTCDERCVPGIAQPVDGQRLSLGGDLRVQDEEWYLAAEYLFTDAERANIPDEQIHGLLASAGFHISDEARIQARYDWLVYDVAATENRIYTVGYDRNLSRILRLQVEFHLMDDEQVPNLQAGMSGNFQIRF
ncbi:MAG: porin [Balneolaceae bacterium]